MASVNQAERRLRRPRMSRLAQWRSAQLFQSPSGATIRRLPIVHVVVAIILVALGLDELLHTPWEETWQENAGTWQTAIVSDPSNDHPLLPALKHGVWHQHPYGSVVPPVHEFFLRREMVRFRAKDNVIIATIATGGVKDFVHNFVQHLTDIGVNNFLICTPDHNFLEELFLAGIPATTMTGNGSTTGGVLAWGSKAFRDLGEQRITLIRAVLETGTDILHSDVDVVWLRNPLPFMARYSDADMLASSDQFLRSRDDEGLESGLAFRQLNMGVVLFRPRESTMRLLQNWTGYLHFTVDNKHHVDLSDQSALNMAVWTEIGIKNGLRTDGYLFLFDGTLKVGVLPISLFTSGPSFFILRHYLVTRLPPYSIHTTYTCDVWTKRSRFREIKQFYDPPEYYNPPNGVLSFDLHIPPELLNAEGNDTQTGERHAELVQYQLHHLRQAFALATILNRTLVLPRVYCFYHGVTWRWRGAWVRDNKTLIREPFHCPMDQIAAMWELKGMSEEKGQYHSPSVDFREYSFLENPRISMKKLDSQVVVRMCDAHEVQCEGAAPSHGSFAHSTTMQLQRNPTQRQVEAVLKPLSQYKVMHIIGLEDAFGGWDDKVEEARFTRRADDCIQNIAAEGKCTDDR